MTGNAVLRITAGSGLAAGVIVAVGGLVGPGDPPGFDALPEQVVRWTLDDRRRLLVSSAVIAVGLALLIAFYAGLRAMVGRAEGPPALLATVGYGSFLIVIALALVGSRSRRCRRLPRSTAARTPCAPSTRRASWW